MQFSKYSLSPILERMRLATRAGTGSAAYWTSHMVASSDWLDAADSLDHFHWRNQQYPGYIELMPVNHANGLVVLDYGCGPGNDLVGFSEFSTPARLIGADVSSTALKVAKKRLDLHKQSVELIKIDDKSNRIELADASVDLVHSSGVLHHVENLNCALAEIHRVLKPGGFFQVMVYNYNSLWLHLYTAYIHQIQKGLYRDLNLEEAFRRTTDGPHCPISRCYEPSEFVEFVKKFDFIGRFKGSSISLRELVLLPKRFEAIRNRKLNREHRDFLSAITLDVKGHPIVADHVTGINACFEFTKL